MSISSESTTAGDITADQEYLWPTFSNLEPSEEMQLLRARLAQLEREQTMNLLTSSSSNFDLVSRNENGLFGIVGSVVLFIFLIFAILGLNELRAEHEKLSNANKFAEIEQKNVLQEEKVIKLEKYLNDQQLNIVHLQKTVAVLREIVPNRWDSMACHKDLALSEPGRLIVQHKGKANLEWSSVMAEKPMSKNPYFEVKIIEETGEEGFISIGLAIKRMPLDAFVGRDEGTYAYGSVGFLMGHEAEGCFRKYGRPFIFKGIPKFGVGDVIGYGVNLATRQIIYTKNGQRLDTANLLVNSRADLFPRVSLGKSGTKIEANFGPDFKYKF